MYPYRFKIILIIFSLLFICIGVRLFKLQITESDKYLGISKNRRIATYPLESIRGSIFDRHGKILAMDHHTFDISVHYKNLLYSYLAKNNKTLPRISEMKIHKKTMKTCNECHENQDEWLIKLSQLFNLSQDKLILQAEQTIEKIEKLKQHVERKSGRSTRIKEETDYYPVISDVDWEKVVQIEVNRENFSGINIAPRPKRTYPEQKLASHILGYMSKLSDEEWEAYSENWNNFILASVSADDDTSSLLYDGYAKNDFIGRTGVEAQFEEELHGLRGKRFEEIICKNSQVEKVILERPPVPGNNLYLTIDSQIQSYAEKSLGANMGSIVVMDPWSGEILAMASSPGFNPNELSKNFTRLIKHPSKPFLNRSIQGALPPGSIFKIITAAAALSQDSINAQTNFDCCGYTHYKNILFRCWSQAGHGLVTIEDAIPYSCNVFFFETAKILGGESLYFWGKNFGIGEKTEIDLPHEKNGNLPKINTTATAMNIAIGQGALLTTPLQLVRAYAVIANGGTLVQPHTLLKITNGNDAIVRTFKSENNRKVAISPSVLETIHIALIDVITRGTAKNQGLGIYKVAAKTGTAETGRQKINHAWLVGYAPYDSPRYCFAILVEHTPGHGADVAGPIAKELMSHLFPEIEQAS
jgi:penicillin-binding protein 2